MQPKGSPFVVPLRDLVVAEIALDKEHTQKRTWRLWAWIWFTAFALVGVCLLAMLSAGAE
jgi:hypothetical protein